jgi:hypothetical protein
MAKKQSGERGRRVPKAVLRLPDLGPGLKRPEAGEREAAHQLMVGLEKRDERPKR